SKATLRAAAPPHVGSILITSPPKSAMIVAAAGAAMKLAASRTLSPENTPALLTEAPSLHAEAAPAQRCRPPVGVILADTAKQSRAAVRPHRKSIAAKQARERH